MLEKLENQNHQLGKCIQQLQETLGNQRENGFSSMSPDDEDNAEIEPLIIPSHDSTATNKMLTIPRIQELVGTSDPDYFIKLEARELYTTPEEVFEVKRGLDHFSLHSFATVTTFSLAHPHFPILDKEVYQSVP